MKLVCISYTKNAKKKCGNPSSTFKYPMYLSSIVAEKAKSNLKRIIFQELTQLTPSE